MPFPLLFAPAAASFFALKAPAPKPIEPLAPVDVALTMAAPDLTGPWKLVAENRSQESVRFAADARLLTLEIEPPAAVEAADDPPHPRSHRAPKPPKAVQCQLPPELRPSGVVDDRALVLRPGQRYEEVFSPALFCFAPALAKAMVPGARVTAHLGFPLPKTRRNQPAAVRGPFVAEPMNANSISGPLKELVSSPFTLSANPSPVQPPSDARERRDPGGARLVLEVPERVDSRNELTVGMALRVKNTGGRPALLHVRRDNFMFHVDGPDGSADCGQPIENRTVPRDQFTELKPNGAIAVDVWVGEMCSDLVFDRPGLYRVDAALAFPTPASGSASVRPWVDPVGASQPVLVRVREGRLPFYTSRPMALGGYP